MLVPKRLFRTVLCASVLTACGAISAGASATPARASASPAAFAPIESAIDRIIRTERGALLPSGPHGSITHCSQFVRDVAGLLFGAAVTRTTFRAQANDQARALARLAANPSSGWRRIAGGDWKAQAHNAALAASAGTFAVLTWINPHGHGHIAIVDPATPGGVRLAQAGLNTFCGLTGVDRAAPLTCAISPAKLRSAVFYAHALPASAH